MDEDEDGAGAQLSSAMRQHIASEMSREATIDKEKRKAREAKEPRAKAKGGKKGESAAP